MKKLVCLLTLTMLVSIFPAFAASEPQVTVILESPSGTPSANQGDTIMGRVRFLVEGEGKAIIWGRFMVDGTEGPQYYRTFTAPSEPLVFEAPLPTTVGGVHDVYFELLWPKEYKTKTVTYKVNTVDKTRITITGPTSGKVVQPGEKLIATAEAQITGWGSVAISGNWIVDGQKIPFTKTASVANTALIKLEQDLPTTMPGEHSFKLEITSPFQEISASSSYTVAAKAPITVKIDPIISSATISLSGMMKITLRINAAQSGQFNLLGYLLVDGNIVEKLEKIITGPGDFTYEFLVPTDKLGPHTAQFKLISPAEIFSNIIEYRVVGEAWVWPMITFPADGTTVNQGAFLEAHLSIKVGGKGTVKVVGVWMLDGNPWRDYEQMLQITSDTIILEKMPLPTDAPGWHKLKFRMTWPHYEESKEIWYRVWGREQPPSFIQITAHPSPPYPRNETFQLKVWASDDRGLKTLTTHVDGFKVVETDLGGVMVIEYVTPSIGPLQPGEHTWRVVLTDLDGLESDYFGKFMVTEGEGTVDGMVLEAITNKPVKDAQVTCGTRTVLTDEYGKYRLTNLGTGDQFVTASHKDYNTGEARVVVHAGVTVQAPTIYLGEKGPQPIIYQIESWPGVIKAGQSFVLSVYVRNDGKDAGLSEVAISCPDNAYIEIDPETGAQYPSFSHVFQPGSFIKHRDGQTIRAVHPVAVVRWNSWGTGVVRKVMLKITCNTTQKTAFWTRAGMSGINHVENYPRLSDTMDQQGWPAKVHWIDVTNSQ